jgi:transketolase
MFTKKRRPDLIDRLIDAVPDGEDATRSISGMILQTAADLLPGLYGGSADLAPSTKTLITNSPSIGPGFFQGRNIHFGIREHGMGAILNGMALYGGIIPYGSTFLVFSDYMRPPIRLAALMGIQVIYVFTHDSFFVGEDGPTHQPVEHLAVLRDIPNLHLFRPADGVETAMGWVHAIERQDGPTVFCLTRQKVSHLSRAVDFDPSVVLRGGYILSPEQSEHPDAVLIASGSEVAIIQGNQDRLLERGFDVRIVSIPCYELFKIQSEEYQRSVIPTDTRVIVVEAGISQYWQGITEGPVLALGMDRFGASAPASVLAEKFGFTKEGVFEMVSCWLESEGD